MKKLLSVLMVAVVSLGLLSACGNNGSTVITIGDASVPVGEATFVLRELETLYEQQYGAEIWTQGVEGVTFDQVAKEGAMESLTRLYISKDVAKANDVTLSDEEEAKIVAMMDEYLLVNTEDALKDDGITLADVKNIFMLNALGEKLMDTLLVGFEADEALLDEALANDMTYQQIEQFGVDGVLEQVTAQHVLISTITEEGIDLTEDEKAEALIRAEEVFQKAQDGVAFDGLVADYSDDPGWTNNGGIYTFYRGEMVAEFEAAAFTMAIGDIEMVESQFGYHIIVKQDHTYPDESQVQNVKDYQDYLVDQYTMTQRQEEYDKLYDQWKDNYDITLDESVWSKVKTTYEMNGSAPATTTVAE